MGSRLSALGRRLRTDPLVWACGTAALVVYLLHGFEARLGRDLAVYSYAGQRVAEGEAPYEGILNRAGPLAHAVPGFGIWAGRLVGADDVVAARVLMMLLSVATVMVVYRVGRDLFASRAAGLASAAAMLCFEGFLRLATAGPREKTTMVLLVVLTLLAMVHRRWGTAGALTALGTLTWQPVALPAIAMLAVAALLGARPGWKGRLVALVRIVVGGAIPTAATVLFYLAIGQLQLFLDDFYLINARYTQQSSVLGQPEQQWENMIGGYGWTVWVLYGGIAAVLLHGVVALLRRGRTGPRPAAQVGLAVFAAGSLLWTLVAFNGWADALVVLPVAALGVGSAVAVLRRLLPVRVAVVLALAWTLVATGLSASYARSSADDRLPEQRAEAEAVMGLLPTGSRLIGVEAPQPLVLTGLRNPSRLQLFRNGLGGYVEDTFPGGLVGYGEWMEDQDVEAVVVGPQGRRSWLLPVLKRSYVRVGNSQDYFRWYIRRDVALTRRAQIDGALAAEADPPP